MFWTFRQNNSGGSFDFDIGRGITHFVIIEAKDYDEAISLAENIGIYFNGCEDGLDCDCCGDRWSLPYGEDANSIDPQINNQKIRENGAYLTRWGGWMDEGREVVIHNIDGSMEWFGCRKP